MKKRSKKNTNKNTKTIKKLQTMTEEGLSKFELQTPQDINELTQIIQALSTRSHDYGTCVYAMSIAATAAFNYMASQLGVSGFQASCADLDVIKRLRNFRYGFQIIDYELLLYPQYQNTVPGWSKLLRERRKELAEFAATKLKDCKFASQEVIKHWETLVQNGED